MLGFESKRVRSCALSSSLCASSSHPASRTETVAFEGDCGIRLPVFSERSLRREGRVEVEGRIHNVLLGDETDSALDLLRRSVSICKLNCAGNGEKTRFGLDKPTALGHASS